MLGLGSAHQVRESRRVFGLIVIATIPAGIMGFVLEHFFRGLFGTPLVAAAFLMVNGLLLLVGERLRAGATGRDDLRPLSSLRMGRAGDRLLAMHRADPGHLALRRHDRRRPAARHRPRRRGAFLLPDRHADHPGRHRAGGAEAAACGRAAWHVRGERRSRRWSPASTAFASTAFLMRYFRRHEAWALNPFAYYCLLVGAGSLAVLLLV